MDMNEAIGKRPLNRTLDSIDIIKIIREICKEVHEELPVDFNDMITFAREVSQRLDAQGVIHDLKKVYRYDIQLVEGAFDYKESDHSYRVNINALYEIVFYNYNK